MSYVKIVNYAVKDILLTGDPNKLVSGTEINTEFAAVATASSVTDAGWTAGDVTVASNAAAATALKLDITAAAATYAPLISPAFTGIPTAPTAALGDNTTKIATMAAVLAQAFTASLPAQGGNNGKFLKTDGVTPSWAAILLGITRSARTSNTILAAADTGTLVDITSGTFSQTFTAAATLGVGWSVWLRNSGTGDITLDPNGAELIDGLATYIMYPQECRLITCDGATFTSVVVHPYFKTFTSTGTYTKPPGYTIHKGKSWNGGSSGQRTNSAVTNSSGGGGGGGGDFELLASVIAATETVTIGAGGLAVSTVANGNVGGNTTFGSLFTVFASTTFTQGGSIVLNLTVSAATVQPVGYESGLITAISTVRLSGIFGGGAAQTTPTVNSGNSVYGAAAGGSLDTGATVFAAGTSTFAGNGGAAVSATSGVAGTAPGGGGGATQTGTSSGAGARGELRIWGIV